MTRILFFGDLAGTGFGTVTMDLGRALLALGHDLRFVSQNDLGEGLPEPFLSRTFTVSADLTDPERRAVLGTNSLALMERGIAGLLDGTLWPEGWKPEAVIILGDYANVEGFVFRAPEITAAFASVPTFHYCPIEGVDLPPTWRRLWAVVRPIAMCEFGAEQIERVLGVRPPMVYHGVDASVFRPATAKTPLVLGHRVIRSKVDAKAAFIEHIHSAACPTPCEVREMGWGEAKRVAATQRWLLRTDRHMPRKRYASMLRAIAPVMATRGDVIAVLHCRSFDFAGKMPDLIAKYPAAIASRMVMTGYHDQMGGAPREVLVALYNAADVYLSTSAEGFGLTIAEAIACGTPAVGMDYSSVPEVIGPAGLLAPVDHLIDNEYDYAWAAVNEAAFGSAVAHLLDNPAERALFGVAGPRHVRASFDWTEAARAFSGIIAESA